MKQLDLFGMWEQPQVVEETKLPAEEKTTAEEIIKPVESNVIETGDNPVIDIDAPEVITEIEMPVTEEASFAAENLIEDTITTNIVPAKEVVPENIDTAAGTVNHSNGYHKEATLKSVESSLEGDTIYKKPLNVLSDEAPTAPGQVVFSDDKISVKIKLKESKPVTEPEPVAEEVAPSLEQTSSKPVEKRPIMVLVKKRGRKSFKEIDLELDLVEVPDDEVLFQKQYYAISQVAQWFHVNTSLVRYWENEFDILKPRKNRKGDRLFRPEDVKNMQIIYYLLRQRKFSIEGAKKYLKENRKSADTNVQLIQSLTKFRSFLLELKANLGA